MGDTHTMKEPCKENRAKAVTNRGNQIERLMNIFFLVPKPARGSALIIAGIRRPAVAGETEESSLLTDAPRMKALVERLFVQAEHPAIDV